MAAWLRASWGGHTVWGWFLNGRPCGGLIDPFFLFKIISRGEQVGPPMLIRGYTTTKQFWNKKTPFIYKGRLKMFVPSKLRVNFLGSPHVMGSLPRQ